MRPLAFSERGLVQPTVSLRELLRGDAPPSIGDESTSTLADYTDEILRSGFPPGIRDLPSRARGVQLDSYLRRIVERELPENGMLVRRPATLMSWLAAYGAATATDASYTAILDAATAGQEDKPARQTVDVYRDYLQRVFVLDPVQPWMPVLAPLRRLTRTPKHHLSTPPRSLRASRASTRLHSSTAKAAGSSPLPTRGSARCSNPSSRSRCASTLKQPKRRSGICEHGTRSARSTSSSSAARRPSFPSR